MVTRHTVARAWHLLLVLAVATCAPAHPGVVVGTGNGVYISPDGDIATAAHVVACKTVEVWSSAYQPIPAVVTSRGDPFAGLDVAILSTGRPSPAYVGINPLQPHAPSTHLDFNRNALQIWTYGPDVHNQFVAGEYARLLGIFNNQRYAPGWRLSWLISKHTRKGESGSPVIDPNGRLLGLISAFISENPATKATTQPASGASILDGQTVVVPSFDLQAIDNRLDWANLPGYGRPQDAVVHIRCRGVDMNYENRLSAFANGH